MSEHSQYSQPFWRRTGEWLLTGLAGVPGSLWRGVVALFRSIGGVFRRIGERLALVCEAITKGDTPTRVSLLIMGAGCWLRGQWLQGLAYTAAQMWYWWYMLTNGFRLLGQYLTLGTAGREEIWDEELQIWIYSEPDNSLRILLFGTITLLLTLFMVYLYTANIKSSLNNQRLKAQGKPIPTAKETLYQLTDRHFHKVLLSVPTVLLVIFTLLPIIFMVLMAFTNFDKSHQPPGNLFTWTGLDTFRELFGGSSLISNTFVRLLGWTLVWAFFATFTNYIFGIILALLINRKSIRLKGMWRTIFVMTIAVPQFVSLLLMSQLLSEQGTLNVLLQEWGLVSDALPFLTNPTWARVTVIIVNMWVGIPYTLLITTGILMNIPEELYESARIDGAGPFATFTKITMPYMLFVTAPYLITQFIGNVNNFNLIYLLTGGGPLSLDYYQAGKTDLLVTWLYKQTVNEQNYNLASAIGILVFILSAVLSLLVYTRSAAVRKEEEFQ